MEEEKLEEKENLARVEIKPISNGGPLQKYDVDITLPSLSIQGDTQL